MNDMEIRLRNMHKLFIGEPLPEGHSSIYLDAAEEIKTLQSKLQEYEKAEREHYSHSLKVADVVIAGLQSRLDAALARDAMLANHNCGSDGCAVPDGYTKEGAAFAQKYHDLKAERDSLASRLDSCRAALKEAVEWNWLDPEPPPDEVTERIYRELEPLERALGDETMLADGFGGVWPRCERAHECGLQIVRPGKASCEDDQCPRVVERHGTKYVCSPCGAQFSALHDACPECGSANISAV